jgi:hypothetical protein
VRLYVAVQGTLDSLAGYLLDSEHDHDPVVYAEVAYTGRLFVDKRGARVQCIPTSTPSCSASGAHTVSNRPLSEHLG